MEIDFNENSPISFPIAILSPSPPAALIHPGVGRPKENPFVSGSGRGRADVPFERTASVRVERRRYERNFRVARRPVGWEGWRLVGGVGLAYSGGPTYGTTTTSTAACRALSPLLSYRFVVFGDAWPSRSAAVARSTPRSSNTLI